MRDGPPQLSRVARQSAAAATVQLPLPPPPPPPPPRWHHPPGAHGAVSAAGRPQQPRPHHRHRARGACGARPRDRSPRDARRHRGAAPHRAVPGRSGRVRGRGLDPAVPARRVPDRSRGRQATSRPPARAARPAAPLDPVLALFEPHRRRLHRPAGALPRGAPREPRRGARATRRPSRVPLDRGVCSPGAVLRREPVPGGRPDPRPGDPRRQGGLLRPVRQPAHGDPRPRDARPRRVARRLVRARAGPRVPHRADRRRSGAGRDAADPARRQRRALPRERREPRARRAAPLARRRRERPAGGRMDELPPALLVGGAGREPRAPLAQLRLRRRVALRVRRGRRRDGAPAFRLAAHAPRAAVARLSLRRRPAARRRGRQRADGRAPGREPRRVQPALRVPPPRARAGRGLLSGSGAALGRDRAAQLAARAAELLALWDEKTEPTDGGAAGRIAHRAEERRRMWRDLLLFGEHTWGSAASGSDPDGAETVAQWREKRRFLDGAAAAAGAQVGAALLRIGLSTGGGGGPGRVVLNAAGRRLVHDGRDWPAVDLPDGSALVVARDVPALGYVALAESERAANPPREDGTALEAQAGRFHVVLDPASGAIRSLTTGDGRERVRPTSWPGGGLNQLVYVRGGRHSALWTEPSREFLRAAPDLTVSQAQLVSARRERLPGIGVQLVVQRKVEGAGDVTSVVTLYDELPWLDVENCITKPATLEKEALYVAFPFALTRPTVEVEVPLGRMTVDRDQQRGGCRDWYAHAHWVWLHDAADGMLWSGPDTPLLTLNDIFRGQWRRTLEPDGTLFAYVLHNYWPTNFAARQGGDVTCRFRLSPLAAGGDPAEPVRRGWAACDPLYVSAPYASAGSGRLPRKDSGLFVADPGVAVVGAKPADDRSGAVVKLLDVTGVGRAVAVWPGAYTFRGARRANFVEMNGDPIPIAPDGRVTLELPAWGVGALRLFTPRERAG